MVQSELWYVREIAVEMFLFVATCEIDDLLWAGEISGHVALRYVLPTCKCFMLQSRGDMSG